MQNGQTKGYITVGSVLYGVVYSMCKRVECDARILIKIERSSFTDSGKITRKYGVLSLLQVIDLRVYYTDLNTILKMKRKNTGLKRFKYTQEISVV